nr:B3 domain-containing protein Os03g0212300-like [Lolium perenne]
MSWDRLRLWYASIVDGQEPHHLLLCVPGGATDLWPAEVMFDGEGQMFLHNAWRSFVCSHTIDVRYFVVFKYDGHDDFNVKVFDETMCRRHYHSNEND